MSETIIEPEASIKTSEVSPTLEKLHRQNNFDLLRLIGALFVVIGHIYYTYFGRPGDWFSRVSGVQHGALLGVGIFFVISGYLVWQSRSRSASVVDFALKRAFRIIPALVVCVLILAVVVFPFSSLSLASYLLSREMLGFLLNIFIFPYNNCVAPIAQGYVTGCNLLGATWTLIFEVLLYMIVGALGYVSRTLQLRFLVTALVVLLILFAHRDIDQSIEFNLKFYGVSVFYIHNRGFAFVALFIVGALLNFIPKEILKSREILIVATALYIGSFYTDPTTYLLAQSITLPFIVVGIGLRRFRLADIVVLTGDLSYSIYLYHFPIMTLTWIALHNALPAVGLTVVALTIIFVVALLSFNFVERPALNFIHRAKR